jgi:hypothetical protein
VVFSPTFIREDRRYMHSKHLTAETVLDLLEERLSEDQTLGWKQHVNECARCKRCLAEWEDFVTLIKRSSLQSAPQRDVDRATRIFRQQPDEPRPGIRCILATTLFDTFSRPVLAGARGAPGTARNLVLRAQDFDIHVQIRGEREQKQILGQILSRRCQDFVASAQLHLLRNGERLQAVASDTLGEFHFTDVPEGELSLQVDLPQLTIIGALNVK